MQLNKAIDAVVQTPSVTFSLVGPPGVGKTQATAAVLRGRGYDVRVVACQNLLLEDTSRIPELVNGEVFYRPNNEWVQKPGRKTAFILDELSKADQHVVNAFLPLLHGRPRSFMGLEYSTDTVVVVTGNPVDFNAGDAWRPHIVNRLVNLNIDAPETEVALHTMTMLGFDAMITAWVEATPAALNTFDPAHNKLKRVERGQYFGWASDNPLAPFCSMRTLEMLSNIIKENGGQLPDDEIIRGCIGAAAAASLLIFCKGVVERVSHTEILQSPTTARVPRMKLDKRLVAIQCANNYTVRDHEALFTYARRLGDDTYVAVFGSYLKRLLGASNDLPDPNVKFRLAADLNAMFTA